MKTTIIPAQITTVEDKIAGNLNLTQILLLLSSLLFNTLIFTTFPPAFKVTIYKILLIITVFLISFALAFRLKGKVVLNWLLILAKFIFRPRFYVFDKNDSFMRSIEGISNTNETYVPKKKSIKTPNSQKISQI